MIKTIIFDFGGVFIDLDKEAIGIEMERLGLGTIPSKMIDRVESYEKGLIGTEAFMTFLKEQFRNETEDVLINAWNSTILDIPEHRLKFIENLRSDGLFQLILLSNTNELHIQKAIENMGISRFNRFKNSFHYFYLSHEIKMRKPDPEIFNYILKKHALIPGECLFIDDTATHTESASTWGLNTWKIDVNKEDITSLFEVKESLFI